MNDIAEEKCQEKIHREIEIERENKLVFDWFENHKTMNLSKFCVENGIDKKGKDRICRLFTKMRKSFVEEAKKLIVENIGTDNDEAGKFENTQVILKNQSPPLMYIVWTGIEWIIPTYEEKIYNGSMLGSRYIKIASKHLEDMIKGIDLVIASPEFKNKEPNELLDDVELFDRIVELYQILSRHYKNRMKVLLDTKPLSIADRKSVSTGIWSKQRRQLL